MQMPVYIFQPSALITTYRMDFTLTLFSSLKYMDKAVQNMT